MDKVPKGATLYKKKEGILTLSGDFGALTWTPSPATGPPTLSIAVPNITNLQQTPDTAAKVFLKILEKPRGGSGDPVSYLFQFTSPDKARAEAKAVTTLLSNLIKGQADPSSSLRKPAEGDGASADAGPDGVGGPGVVSGPASRAPAAVKWLDDTTLMGNAELQASLVAKDQRLRQTFEDAKATKPASVSDTLFATQFWSTRVGLLRAHAIEETQRQGAYNVLAAVKPQTVDDRLRLNLSVQNIIMLFEHFPLVKQLYNENVLPNKLDESKFWERFFNSRLSRRLKGERVGDDDHADALFDRYSEVDNLALLGGRAALSRIAARQAMPHALDLEGNEENKGGFKGGNRPDVEMRAGRHQKTVSALNRLSEIIIAAAAPIDRVHDPSEPAAGGASANAADHPGLDEDTMRAVALRDLGPDPAPPGLALHVKDQSRLLRQRAAEDDPDSEAAALARVYAQQDPADVLFLVTADMDTLEEDGAGGLDIRHGIGVDDDSDSDGDGDGDAGPDGGGGGGGATRQPHVGSRAARMAARRQLLDGMKKRRVEFLHTGSADDAASPMGIPAEIAQRCSVTNATTGEFLKQFWRTLLHADRARSRDDELACHAEALRKCRERIRGLADEAEAEHVRAKQEMVAVVKEHYKRTRTKIKPPPVGGGREAVMALFEATLTSLNLGLERYDKGA
ncbi:hypothetical protein P8C59_005915 [Phyllachora maydis]|uniref:BSD domain-containing protein n=1 Tax=Phyllachora maydis TaxID=1825666 RepID=A0AAD9I5D2_9PEZI|nr:hypothetical protein P8C59_005915 [Phyllachora maydis]